MSFVLVTRISKAEMTQIILTIPDCHEEHRATYHKLVHDLDRYGYLCYEPSFYKGRASRISMIEKR